MQRKRQGLDEPMTENLQTSPQAGRGFTRFDQVNQLVGASEADPDLGFMARLMALCSLAPYQPRQPASVYPAKRTLRLSHDCRW